MMKKHGFFRSARQAMKYLLDTYYNKRLVQKILCGEKVRWLDIEAPV
ncbi:hypothetical protein PL10110_590018 [Planktothrix agardhii]|nr:hypothetical protein PL10110_590018 [Planktothrix agardhii]